MTYKIFLDDERFPPGNENDWVIARTVFMAKDIISERGWPNFISFDHDLGEGVETGHDFVKWIINMDMRAENNDYGDLGPASLPDDFAFTVHSQNPIGAENMQKLLDQYLSYKKQRLM